jgi:undecaprenyl-diphosphatase
MNRAVSSSPAAHTRPLLLFLLGILLLSLFALVAVGVRQRTLFTEWDEALKEALHAHAVATPGAAATFAALTELAADWVLYSVAGLLLLVFALIQKWRWAGIWMLAFSGNYLGRWFKVVIDRHRPVFVDPIINVGGPAFPSGHAVGATIMFGMLAYFLAKSFPKLRMGVLVAAVWFILVIDFSRIYLGAHWFSDALGATLFGLGWIMIWIAAAEAMEGSTAKADAPSSGEDKA